MSKNKRLSVSIILLFILGMTLLYIGGFYGPKIIFPPIITPK